MLIQVEFRIREAREIREAIEIVQLHLAEALVLIKIAATEVVEVLELHLVTTALREQIKVIEVLHLAAATIKVARAAEALLVP